MEAEKLDKIKAACGYFPFFGLSLILPIVWLLTKPSPFLKGHAIRSLILQVAVGVVLLLLAGIYQTLPKLIRVFVPPIPVLTYFVLTILWMIQATRGIAVGAKQRDL